MLGGRRAKAEVRGKAEVKRQKEEVGESKKSEYFCLSLCLCVESPSVFCLLPFPATAGKKRA